MIERYNLPADQTFPLGAQHTPEPVGDDGELTYSIRCDACGAFPDELCEGIPDGQACIVRNRSAIVSCDWMVDTDPYLFAPVAMDRPWTGGVSPVVDEFTRDCIAQYGCADNPESVAELMAIRPDGEGYFHLLSLGWTFTQIREARPYFG